MGFRFGASFRANRPTWRRFSPASARRLKRRGATTAVAITRAAGCPVRQAVTPRDHALSSALQARADRGGAHCAGGAGDAGRQVVLARGWLAARRLRGRAAGAPGANAG